MDSRRCSNVSTLNARLVNSAPPFTKPFPHALILGWIPLMHSLLSSVTKIYVSVEAQALAIRLVDSPRQPSTPWLVALSVRPHMSVLVRHAASAIMLLKRMACQFYYQWLFLQLSTRSAQACQPRQQRRTRMPQQNLLRAPEKAKFNK